MLLSTPAPAELLALHQSSECQQLGGFDIGNGDVGKATHTPLDDVEPIPLFLAGRRIIPIIRYEGKQIDNMLVAMVHDRGGAMARRHSRGGRPPADTLARRNP